MSGTPITEIRGLGPATAEALMRAGIPDAETLRDAGADQAYRRLLDAGTRPHFIGYYALHMALQGRPWNDCKGAEKEMFRKKFDDLVAQGSTTPPGIEAILDQIGTGLRR